MTRTPSTYYYAFRRAIYEFKHALWKDESRVGFDEVEQIPDKPDDEPYISGQHSGIYHRQSNIVYHAFYHRYFKREFKTEREAIRFMAQARMFCED